MKAGQRLSLASTAKHQAEDSLSIASVPVSPTVRQFYAYRDTPRARTPKVDLTTRSSRVSAQTAPAGGGEEPSIFITPEIEGLVTEWLSALGLSQTAPRPQAQVTTDPFRNGVLACELTQILEKRPIDGIVRTPSTTNEIAQNFQKALKSIQKSHPPAFNPAYYALAGRLAKGGEELLWGFYWTLFNAYPRVVPPHLEEVAKVLPYDSVGIRRLEEGLLGWMRWMGVAQQYGNPTSLVELIPHIRTGYLLCHLVSQAFSYPLPEVFPNPKSEGAILTNLRKALDVLKKHPNMSQKFVWGKEKEIMKGNMGVVMGLLEDVCRCGDGLPVRKPGQNYHSDGPYCWSPSKPSIIPADFSPSQCLPTAQPPPDIVPSPKFMSSLLPPDGDLSGSEDIDLPQFDASVKKWLSSIGIPRFSESYFGGSRINELRDGVVLCEIIETLERRKLPGVEYYPKSAAACKQNVRRGLEFLRGKPTFPGELYYVEEELRRGDGRLWRKVLVEMQRVYKFAVGKKGDGVRRGHL